MTPLSSPVKLRSDLRSYHRVAFITAFIHRFFYLLVAFCASRAVREVSFLFFDGSFLAPPHFPRLYAICEAEFRLPLFLLFRFDEMLFEWSMIPPWSQICSRLLISGLLLHYSFSIIILLLFLWIRFGSSPYHGFRSFAFRRPVVPIKLRSLDVEPFYFILLLFSGLQWSRAIFHFPFLQQLTIFFLNTQQGESWVSVHTPPSQTFDCGVNPFV